MHDAVQLNPLHDERAALLDSKPLAKPFTKAQVKHLAVRKWLSVNQQGETSVLEVDKLRVTHQLGVQLRDLRLLDPQLATSYPSAILCRDRALVLNLEFVKCIVTMSSVYVTNLEDENTVNFVEELQRRLAAAYRAGLGSTDDSSAALASSAAAEASHASHATSSRLPGGAGLGAQAPSSSSLGGAALAGLGAAGMGAASGLGLDHMGHPEDMPFELRALEVALDTVTGYLERLTGDLEAAAHPALDALTARINTSNLERVRRIKNRMVRLTTRVETLREVLEKLLDDDGDMKDMNLSAKAAEEAEMLARQNLRAASMAATPFDVPLPVTGGLGELGGAMTPFTPHSVSSRSSASTDLEDDEAVEAVEMLLEPYFMMLDNNYNKLQTLCEYVDDTEDFINIELDSHRNALIRIDLILTAFTAAMGLITAITGLFAMNVQLRPVAENPGPYSMFVMVSVTSGGLAMAVFCGVVAFCKYKRII